jgi:hypothetical protein
MPVDQTMPNSKIAKTSEEHITIRWNALGHSLSHDRLIDPRRDKVDQDGKGKERRVGSGFESTGVHKIALLQEIARSLTFLTGDYCQFFSMDMQGNESSQ